MKVVQIVTTSKDQVIALTEGGEIFFGFFTDVPLFTKPAFMWRKLPVIPKGTYEYARGVEPTDEELKAAIDRYAVAQLKISEINQKVVAKKRWWHRAART
jgi:hypothetical protein